MNFCTILQFFEFHLYIDALMHVYVFIHACMYHNNGKKNSHYPIIKPLFFAFLSVRIACIVSSALHQMFIIDLFDCYI